MRWKGHALRCYTVITTENDYHISLLLLLTDTDTDTDLLLLGVRSFTHSFQSWR